VTTGTGIVDTADWARTSGSTWATLPATAKTLTVTIPANATGQMVLTAKPTSDNNFRTIQVTIVVNPIVTNFTVAASGAASQAATASNFTLTLNASASAQTITLTSLSSGAGIVDTANWSYVSGSTWATLPATAKTLTVTIPANAAGTTVIDAKPTSQPAFRNIRVTIIVNPVPTNFTVAASGAYTQPATGSSFSIDLQVNAAARTITLTSASTGTGMTDTADWTRTSGSSWATVPATAKAITVTIPANATGQMVINAKPTSQPSFRTIQVTINVTDFRLYYSERNTIYGANADAGAVTMSGAKASDRETATSLTIDLCTPPIGSTSRHFRTYSGQTGTTSANQYLSISQTGNIGTATVSNLGNGVSRLTVPQGYQGTITLTSGSFRITVNVTPFGARNSDAVGTTTTMAKVGDTMRIDGLEWRVLGTGIGLARDNKDIASDALVITEKSQFSSRFHRSDENNDGGSFNDSQTATWNHNSNSCELRWDLNTNSGRSNSTTAWKNGRNQGFTNRIRVTHLQSSGFAKKWLGDYNTPWEGSDHMYYPLSAEEVFGSTSGGDISRNLYHTKSLMADGYARSTPNEEQHSTWLRSRAFLSYSKDVNMTLLCANGFYNAKKATTTSVRVRIACRIDMNNLPSAHN